MFETAWKILQLTALVLLLLTLIFNINPSWPRMPWDVSLRRPLPPLYIPIISSIIISMILALVQGYFQK